ncbi:MAG: hypothetical protein QJR09_11995 [Micrococcus sp.]|nr:hypothetical protein [Micrococcus sp.]
MNTAYTPEDFRNALRLSGVQYLGLNDQQARDAMALLGLTVKEPKPERGTWHRVTDGVYSGQCAYVNGHGSLMIFTDIGDYDVLAADREWPALTLAQMVLAEAVEDARDVATVVIRDAVEGYIRTHLNIADTGGENAHSGTINTIRHLHLPEPHLPAVEAVDKLAAAGLLTGQGGPRKGDVIGHMVPADAPETADEQVQEDANVEWAAYRKNYGISPVAIGSAHKAFHAGYRAALPKSGHGATAPNRDQVSDAIRTSLGVYMLPSKQLAKIADAVMALFKGGTK